MSKTTDTLRKLREEANPGRVVLLGDHDGDGHYVCQKGDGGALICTAETHESGALIAAAVNALPALIEAVEAVGPLLDAVEDHRAALRPLSMEGTETQLDALQAAIVAQHNCLKDLRTKLATLEAP